MPVHCCTEWRLPLCKLQFILGNENLYSGDSHFVYIYFTQSSEDSLFITNVCLILIFVVEQGEQLLQCWLLLCTIRDAILTCAWKPTWVGLIYHTETTTKNCKTEKLKCRNSLTVKVWENHVVSPEEEKERLQWERFAEKEGFKSVM